MLNFVEFLSSDSEDESSGQLHGTRQQDSDFEEDQTSRNLSFEDQKPTTIHSKPRELQQKKLESIALIKQLRTHIHALEKEKNSQFYDRKKKGSTEEYQQSLHDVESKLNQQRKNEYDTLKENLNRTTNKLEKFKSDKMSAHKNTVYLDKLKVLMEEIEAGIMQFKERQKHIYEDLMVDESNLTKEMENYSKKFESWTSRQASMSFGGAGKGQLAGKNQNETMAPKEVEAFEKFLQATGGHLGGWDEYDHQTFLKLHKKHKNHETLVTAAISDIPTHSAEEIEDHVEWHKQYLLLREHKREAIRNWKKLKQSEKEELLSTPHDVTDVEEEKRRRREEILEKERQQRLMQLQQWKSEQRQKKTEPFDDEREDTKEKMKLKQVLEERRRLETKLQIQEYKLKKKEEEEILRMAKEEEERRKQHSELSTLEKSRIKNRNERMLEQKRVQQINKQLEKEDKEERLKRLKEKVVVNVERDPTRLYKPTEGWIRRQQENGNNDNRDKLNTGTRALPHRAVPSWRQGVS